MFPNLSGLSGSCHHSFGGILLLRAKFIATVQPLISTKDGSWCHYLGGSMPLKDNNIATVYLY